MIKCCRFSMLYKSNKKLRVDNSLQVQGLGFHALTVKGTGLIPDWGTRILQGVPGSQKITTNPRKIQINELLSFPKETN